jgi:uncharacterized protein YerC
VLVQQFCEAVAAIQDAEEAEQFLTDVLSDDELERVALRLEIMRLAGQGYSRPDIQKELSKTGHSASLATISRARRTVVHGGGAALAALGRLQSSTEAR